MIRDVNISDPLLKSAIPYIHDGAVLPGTSISKSHLCSPSSLNEYSYPELYSLSAIPDVWRTTGHNVMTCVVLVFLAYIHQALSHGWCIYCINFKQRTALSEI